MENTAGGMDGILSKPFNKRLYNIKVLVV